METISNKSTSSELEDKSLRSVNEPPLQVQLQSSTAEPKEGDYLELQSSTAEPEEGDYIDCLAPTYTGLIPETTNASYYNVTRSSIVSNSNAAKDLATREKVKLSDTKQSVWSTPFIVITVLLFIILIVIVALLCMMVAHIASNRTSPDFNEWANGVVSKVNSNVTGSLPDFNEWANGVVSQVNSNVTGSLSDFDEWVNGVVSQVNSNVTGSLPDFNEWANGISQNTLQLFQNNTNFTEPDKQILQTTRDSAQKLINIVNTLSNLQDTSTSTAGVVDDVLLIAQELLVLHNDSTALPTSCKEIKERQSLSPSGVYLLASATGGATYTTYCNIGTLCGSGGGWTRLAYLDMSDATQNCPSGFRLYRPGGVRACGRPVTNSGSCVSVQFPSNGISYSQICGRVFGHSYRIPDAVNTDFGSNHNNINSYYVDGVSITRGSPRQHVWTLMAGFDNFFSGGRFNCPCVNGSIQVPQAFVGDHYFVKVPKETGMIDYGMAMTVLLMKHFVALLQAYHGFTETMVALPLLTILS